jgi:hypothetical protein
VLSARSARCSGSYRHRSSNPFVAVELSGSIRLAIEQEERRLPLTVIPSRHTGHMNSEDLDWYDAKKFFGLHGRASEEELVRRVLEVAGSKLDYSDAKPAERKLLAIWCVALAASGNYRQPSSEHLRGASRNAATFVTGSADQDVMRSLAAKLYPTGERTLQTLLSAFGYRALEQHHLPTELDLPEDNRDFIDGLVGRRDDHYSALAEQQGVDTTDEQFESLALGYPVDDDE